MYPEYLNTWNATIAGDQRNFKTRHAAYVAAQRYALTHGLELLDPTPFSDTNAIGVTDSYAEQHHLRTIRDLRRVASTMTLGAAPQLQQSTAGLTTLEQAYGFTPAAFKPLEIGQQYQALDQGAVQAADVYTTDGELTTGNYTLLADPLKVFGIGNVVPVVSSTVLDEEGPAFAATVNRVTSLLTLSAIRAMNAAVDLSGQDPAGVAKRFLVDHGVMPRDHLSRGRSGQPLEPKPPAPRSDSASSSTSATSGVSTLTSTSCAIRSPAETLNGDSRSVFSRSTRSSPR